MTRSKQESTATTKLVNLETKRDKRLHGVLLWNGAGTNPILKDERRFFRSLFGCGSAALGFEARIDSMIKTVLSKTENTNNSVLESDIKQMRQVLKTRRARIVFEALGTLY